MLKYRFVHSLAMCCFLLAGLATHGHSQESRNSDGAVATGLTETNRDESTSEAPRATLIYSLRSRPADMVANIIAKTMEKNAELTIVPDQVSNMIIICGSVDTLKECQEILKTIDQPRRLICFDVVITVMGSGTTADDKNKPGSTDRIQFATLNENPATFEFGQRIAVVTGTTISATKQPVKQLQYQQVGTMCIVTPRIAGEEISVDLQIEKSWLVPPTSGDDTDDANPAINTATVKSTVSLKPGIAHTILSTVSQGTNAAENVSITITASLDQ